MMNDLDRAKQALELYVADGNVYRTKILTLVTQGVDVNARGDNNWTLLHCAARSGHLEVCEKLIQQGAEIDARSKATNTPLHFAVWHGHTAIVKFLLDRGAEIDARDNDGYTPLQWAAVYGGAEYAQLFLEHGADIEARGKWYRTPLYDAAENGKTETVKYLLEQGANIWAEKDDKKTALDEDKTGLLEPHREQWKKVLEEVRSGDLSGINTTQDIYHLASVMKPANPKDIPPPKEFIRLLFQQYLPHDDKFNAMYEEIFAQPRPLEQNLQSARQAAKNQRLTIL
jgi:hypothetical protein